MSVASSNPFALLPDNAVDTEVSVQAIKGAKKAAAAAKTTAATPAAERAQPAERSLKRDYPTRGGHRRTVGRNAGASEETAAYPTHDKTRSRPSGPRRGGRPEGGRPPRRQFDRHSGTGLVDSEKKEKQGWLGDDKATVEDGEKAAEQAKKDGEESAAPAVEEVEEDVKTLEDYLKERATTSVDTERAIRKANDAGVDKKQLQNSVQFTREEDVFFAPIAAQKSRKAKAQKEKVFVDIEQRFTDEQRRGAFRGGRGGQRGGDRRGPRQGRVDVNDQRAFPSL
ncbi:hypothetical protein FBU59_004707 [Linderina macrospora]|uniref:Uncharacterized protein n=1 Tax=Linderina macrospora TaxID=4868 RepID=A0ACC1J4X6_9FUNG|nr:hypothetical protein FBU59_004707 [Linderina macrospora]